MQKLIYITSFAIIILAVWACQKDYKTRIPVSEKARAWVPENQDSVWFETDLELPTEFAPIEDGNTNRDKDNYLIYKILQSDFSAGENQREIVTQTVRATLGNFQLNYKLTAGFPTENDTAGIAHKMDILTIDDGQNTRQLFITNTASTTDLFVIDSLDFYGENYRNVLTDSTNYFFNQAEGIIAFFNGTKWYYKK